MIKRGVCLISICLLLIITCQVNAQKVKGRIYRKGWIDLNKNGSMDIYENPSADIEDRIQDLLSQMTMNEKTVQMVTLYGYGRVLKDDLPTPEWENEIWKDGIGAIDEHLNGFVQWGKAPSDNEHCWPASKHAKAINKVQRFFIEDTRLGIPVDFTNEGIRGVENLIATNFPTQLGIGQTWNRSLVHKIGEITGKEARVLGYTNVYAPILDVGRDQRWGRMEEVYGESPFLVAELGIEMTKGLQEEGNVAATAKHFAIYSANKGGREGLSRVDPQISYRESENIHLYPFRRVIEEANIMGVMSSYNDYDGVPVQASYYYLTEKLRKEYGFKGYVVSDSDAVIYLYNKHKTAKDYKEAVRQSVEAGLNVRCTFRSPSSFVLPLRELIEEGGLSLETINERVADILRVKFQIGLFDNPYVEDTKKADQIVNCEKHNEIALQVSKESLVLLKNEDELLPLNIDKIKKISVCGPNAHDASYALTHYGPLAVEVTTVLDGLRNEVGGKCEIVYTKGCEIVDENWPDSELISTVLNEKELNEIEKARKDAAESDVAIVVVGGSQRTCGENKSRTSLNLPGHQLDLIQAVYSTGTPTVVIVISGRPLSINWTAKNIPAILQAFYPGSKGGEAISDVLFGKYNPGGKLTVTFPKTVGQIPFNFPAKPNSQVNAWGQTGLKGKRSRVNDCIFPFGYGLSYTSFKYSNLQITPKVISTKQKVKVSLDVTNTGDVAGDEIVQLYTNDIVSSVTTYEKNLRGFERIHLETGETQKVAFELSPDDLMLINENKKRVVEQGEFKVMIGASSEDIRLNGKFEVVDIENLAKILESKSKISTSNFIKTEQRQQDVYKLVDGDCNIAWNAGAGKAAIDFELIDKALPKQLGICWGVSKKKQYKFEIQLSGGGGQFITVHQGVVSSDSKGFETYLFEGFPATDLRLVCESIVKDEKVVINEIKLKELKGISVD
jgi:beta-glucosidase